MKHHRLTQREHTQHQAEQHTTQAGALEFASVEDVLRHDIAQMDVPPALTRKIQEAAGNLPTPKRVWWRQLFGR